MHLTRRALTQLVVFVVISIVAVSVMGLRYIDLPAMLFGAGQYQVTVELPQAAGLYESSNVTYRGTEVGRVKSVSLTRTGAQAVLSLTKDVKIPADLQAEVHSQSAIGEQYVALLPTTGGGPYLKNGDVIPLDRTSVPPDINSLLGAANRGLEALPRDNLKTVVDEAYIAFAGLGPEISRIVRGSTTLAIDARKDLDSLTTLIDEAAPVLNSQTNTSDSIRAWAANFANITNQLRNEDNAVQGLLDKGPAAADEIRAVFDRLNPTLPVLLANMVSVNEVLVTYHAGLEQLLVFLPIGVADVQALGTANRNTKQDYAGAFLSFNLNLNYPPPCNTGFLPIQQQRGPAYEDAPDRPADDIYCRIPQDSPFNVRGVRNTPCVTKPGKRAPTAKMCKSDEEYVPLNDGYNWKGDPNATLSGQDVPQVPTGSAPAAAPPPPAAPVPVAIAEYDPQTGNYIGPDGNLYTQSNLAHGAQQNQTWQSMLVPPGN